MRLDEFAAALPPDVRDAVRNSSKASFDKAAAVLRADLPDAGAMRRVAGGIRQHAIDHLDTYLEQAERALTRHGAKVHYASDAEGACETVLRILRDNGARRVCKSKSMATEEVGLLEFLNRNGIETVETDLGEFIVQLDEDRPSHIVKPIIHKSRREIARTLERCGLGAHDENPETITRRARQYMRRVFLEADAGISGANFVVAESGRLVIVTNEGNSRFGLAAANLHIALVGIDKIVPRDRDLAPLLNLLARSATGQSFTSYVELIQGPKRADRPEGPEEMHVVFLDNGRTEVLASEGREILGCIRCGACMNVCPVYRQATGHAYRGVYPGPLGSVLQPLQTGAVGLANASTLCGACRDVCPVDIPIPDLLRGLRSGHGFPSLRGWSLLATHPRLWRLALLVSRILPRGLLSPRAWKLPPSRGGAFRRWMRRRS
jgi:L-lactate dehydrogenase complex protein LldF